MKQTAGISNLTLLQIKTMKNLFKSIASVAIVAMAFAGCSKEATDVTAPITKKGITVRFNAEVIDETRATLAPDESEKTFKAAWEDKDQIGITAESLKGDDIQEDDNLCGKRENGVFSTTFQNCTEAADLWYYNAYYPYTDNTLGYKNCQIVIPFGGDRIQYGNYYNSAYDIMAASIEMIGTDLQPGVDENGDKIVFNMKRMTAIAYFHFTTTAEAKTDKVLSVTLSATSSKELEPLAANGAVLYYGTESTTKHSLGFHDGATNSIKITYDSATAPTAADFKAWFNVLPGTFSNVKLVIETENYTAEIARTGEVIYEAGKLAKVAGNISDGKWVKKEIKEVVPNGTVLWSEDFSSLTTISSQSGSATAYNGDTIAYKFSSTSKIYKEALAGGTSPELLLAKNSTWKVSDIPTGNCSNAVLTFKSNRNTNASWGVSSTTTGITVGEPVVESPSANKYVITYSIACSGVEKFDLTFTNSKDNARIDDIELVAGTPLIKLNTPNVTATADDEGNIKFTWAAVENAGDYTVTINDKDTTVPETEFSFNATTAGDYTISVVANPSDTETYCASKAGEATATIIGNPASAKISAISANVLTASWDAVDGAASYNWVVKNGDNEVKSGNIAGTTLSLTDITLAADTEYVLYVKSVATAPQGSLATFTQSEPNLYSENPIIKVAQSAIEVDADQATGTIAVTAENVTADAQFAVQCSAEFITATLSDDHTTLSYTIAANDTGAERTGTITITLTEGAHSDSAEISVTQKEASAKTATLTLSSSKKFGTTTGSTLKDSEGNTWTMTFDKATPYNTYNNSYKGQQFGTSKTNGTVTFASTIAGKTIKSVSVTAAAGSTVATVEITVNGESWGSEKLDKTSKTYTKTGNDSGEISITLKQNTTKAVYLGAISVIYQ